jgi:hypothetical protein
MESRGRSGTASISVGASNVLDVFIWKNDLQINVNIWNKKYKYTRDLSPSFSMLWWIGGAAAPLRSFISSISAVIRGGDLFVHH